MKVDLNKLDTYRNAYDTKNYDPIMGWERTSGTPTQFASSTNPQIYGLVVGYYARFLIKHNLVTSNGMLKQFTASGGFTLAKDHQGKQIRATSACLNLRLLMYNTKLKMPGVGDNKPRTFNYNDCNLKFVPRDAATGEPKLMGQLQVIHALTNSYGEDDKPIWSMKFLNLRKEKFYPK